MKKIEFEKLNKNIEKLNENILILINLLSVNKQEKPKLTFMPPAQWKE